MTGDFDRAAETLYRAAGFSSSEQAPPFQLAERLLGNGCIHVAPARAMASRGALVRLGTNWRIYVNADCAPERRRFVLLHELSHWALPEATEEECDRLAGALLLPRAAFLRCASHGPSAATCRRFGVDGSCAWLRYGETVALEQGEAIALIAPSSVRLRGAAYSWPAASELRRLVTLPRVRGLRRWQLRDAPGRAVLRAS